jgi:hypothetical protein
MFSAVQAYLYHPLRGVLKPEPEVAFTDRKSRIAATKTRASKVSFMMVLLLDLLDSKWGKNLI